MVAWFTPYVKLFSPVFTPYNYGYFEVNAGQNSFLWEEDQNVGGTPNYNYSFNKLNVYFGQSWANMSAENLDLLFGADRLGVCRVQGSVKIKSNGVVNKEWPINYDIPFGSLTFDGNSGFTLDLEGSVLIGAQPINMQTSLNYLFNTNSCENVPDGECQLLILGRKNDTSGIGQKFPFNFSTSSSRIQINFHDLIASGMIAIDSFIFRASKGFVNGNIIISEEYIAPFGSFVQYPYVHSVPFNSGQKQVKLVRPHYLVYLDTSGTIPVPISCIGKLLLDLEFEALPECLENVESETVEQTSGVLDELVLTEPFEPPTVPPVPPASPEYPTDILITDGPDEIVWPEEFGPIPEPQTPIPPDGVCECEKYVADALNARLLYIQKTLDTRLSQILASEQVTGRKLLEAIQGLQITISSGFDLVKPENFSQQFKQFFMTTEETPRGLADVIGDQEMDPIIIVDTNECFYKKPLPPDGNSWSS